MRGRLASVAFGLLPALIVLGAYAPAWGAALVWDDHMLLGPRLADAGVWHLLTRPFFTASALHDAAPVYYRPLVLLSFKLDVALFGDSARAHHGVSVALHAVNVALLGAWARRLGAGRATSAALSLTWALLPRLSEAVAWVSGRTDVLAMTLGLAAVLLMPERRERGDARRATATVALFAALLSKETALAFAVALAMRGSRRDARWVLGAVVAWLALRTAALGGATSATGGLGLGARLTTCLEALGRYAVMTLDPWRSSSSIGLVGAPDTRYVIVGAASLALVASAAWVGRARVIQRGASAREAWIVAIVAIVPTLHLLRLGLAGAVCADRLLYVPLGAAVVGLAATIRTPAPDATPAGGAEPARRHADSEREAWLARVVVLAALAVSVSVTPRLRARIREYRDEVRFWVAAAESAHADNAAPLASLAAVVRARGRVSLACRVLARAEHVLARAGRADTPRHRRTLENLGGCLAARGDYPAAVSAYTRALDGAEATAPRVRLGLGYVYMHLLDLDAAERELTRAKDADRRLRAPAEAALSAVAVGRRELPRWPPAARAADPAGWAPVAAVLGRVPDVERGYLARATDAARPREERVGAASELTRLELIDGAEAAAAALSAAGIALDDGAARGLTRLRVRAGEVDAMEGRIEALLAR